MQCNVIDIFQGLSKASSGRIHLRSVGFRWVCKIFYESVMRYCDPGMAPWADNNPTPLAPHHTHNTEQRIVFITRHGESINNLYGKIGGNSGLSQRGQNYARALGGFVSSLQSPGLKVREEKVEINDIFV